MALNSGIEWTEASWNPVTGCSKLSPGCLHCYAEKMAIRLQAMGQKNYLNGFSVRCHNDSLLIPSSWRKPRMIFVNSMSDLFHDEVPDSFVQSVFSVMNDVPRHVYQVLTKRTSRLMEMGSELVWGDNIWAGVSVEDSYHLFRVDHLRSVPCSVRFVSFEPLLGSVDSVDLSGIHWVIAGGESGPGARSMSPAWVRRLRDICIEQNVSFFFKQWGGVRKKALGRELDGRFWDQMPRSIHTVS